MGYTNSTPFLKLPQYLSQDKPAWLTDINTAFDSIDKGVQANYTLSHEAKTAADDAANTFNFKEIMLVPNVKLTNLHAYRSSKLFVMSATEIEVAGNQWNAAGVAEIGHCDGNPLNLKTDDILVMFSPFNFYDQLHSYSRARFELTASYDPDANITEFYLQWVDFKEGANYMNWMFTYVVLPEEG